MELSKLHMIVYGTAINQQCNTNVSSSDIISLHLFVYESIE